MMYVPIRYGSKPVGILSIQSYTPHTYTQQDVETLEALADHCGGALARIRATQRLEQQMQRSPAVAAEPHEPPGADVPPST
jgi:GAF domain-containing protein